jgi:two-component system nitrogen regulation response regulator GlnG
LRNAIEHAMIVARGGVILPEHLPTEAVTKGQGDTSATDAIREQLTRWAQEQWRADEQPEHVYERLLELVEPPVFNVALQEHHGQLAPAARSLGIHRITLRKKLGQSRD